MGIESWWREEIGRILTALASSGRDRGPEYAAALGDVCLAFGLSPARLLGTTWVITAGPGNRCPVPLLRELNMEGR